MPAAAMIDTGGGGDGGGGGSGGLVETIKAHPIVSAAAVGGIVALVVLIRRTGGSSGGAATSLAPDGGTLAPSANAALGQIAYDQTRGFGDAAIAAASNYDKISAILAGLGTQVSGVSNQVTDVGQGVNDVSSAVGTGQANNADAFRNLMYTLLSETHEIRTEGIARDDPAHAQGARDAFNAFQAAIYTGIYGGSSVASPNSLSADPGAAVASATAAA